MKVVRVEEVRSGTRIFGSFYDLDDGTKVYVAYRKYREIYRAGRKSISQALRDGVASWAVDVTTLMEARRRGCTVIGIKVTDRNSFYAAKLEDFINPDLTRLISHESKGGSTQRVLPLHQFQRTAERFSL